MKLPSTATIDDIESICTFLLDKPAGATSSDALVALGDNSRGKRKLIACRRLGFIESTRKGTVKITGRGSKVVANGGEHRTQSFLCVLADFPAYKAAIARAVGQGRFTVTANDVLSLWHERFPSELSASKSEWSNQTNCFFRMLVGAGLGELTVGKAGRQTRFYFDADASRKFVEKIGKEASDAPGGESGESGATATSGESPLREAEVRETTRGDSKGEGSVKAPAAGAAGESVVREEVEVPQGDVSGARRIFIGGCGNARILDQVRELAALGKLEDAAERSQETSSNPAGTEAVDAMRSCRAAVIHAGAGRVFRDDSGGEARSVSENALVQLGIAIALCRRNIILLVENGVELPPGLTELPVCRYSGGELDGASMMTLIKALGNLDFN